MLTADERLSELASRTATRGAHRQLMHLLRSTEYGALRSHAEVASVLGIRWGDHHYYQLVRRALREEASNGRNWRNEIRLGYRLLHPHEAHVAVGDHLSQGKRSVARATDVYTKRDSSRLIRHWEIAYREGEKALKAITGLMDCIEVASSNVGPLTAIKEYRELAEGALSKFRAVVVPHRSGTVKSRSLTNWTEARCRGCNKLLLKHSGVDGSGAGVEVVCKCKAVNFIGELRPSSAVEIPMIDLGSITQIRKPH